MIPLELTSRQQSALADLCIVLRGWLYQELTTPEDKKMDPAELRDRIERVICKYEFKPTELDVLYDRLHRSGANS